MSRIRSRQIESGSVPERAIRRGSVSRDKLQPRAIGAPELLPGSASRAIQGSQVTAEAQLSRETINYFSGVIIPLASESVEAAPQTAGMPPNIEDLEFVEWQQTQAVPGLSGMDEDELRLPATLINTVVNGYCNVVVSGRFASYTGDAKVEIWRWSQRHGDTEDDDLKLVWPPAVWPESVTDGGRLYGEGHAIVVSEGDALAVRVIHDSETPVGLDLAVEVYAVSRYRLERLPQVPPDGPWAWYRGDDIVGATGDLFGTWTDRSGNERHVESWTADTTRWPTILDAALDGHRGGDFRSGDATHLEHVLAAAQTADGWTVVQVFASVTQQGAVEQVNAQLDDSLYTYFERGGAATSDMDLQALSGSVFVEHAPTGGVSGSLWYAITTDGSLLRLVVDGTAEVTNTGAGSVSTSLVRIGATGRAVLLETIVWDRVVDLDADVVQLDGFLGTVAQYVAGRYPSL